MSDRILSIQILRFLAATAVLFQHSRMEMSLFDGHMNLLKFDRGALGVDLFFVISGFIMVWVVEHKPMEPLAFITRRFLRVWPLYLLTTLAAISLASIGFFAGPMDPIFIIKSLFFIPAYRPEMGGLYPFLVPGWTLIIEMAFYTLFGLGLFFRERYVSIFVLVGLTFLVCLNLQKLSPFAVAYGGRNAIMLEFLVGMLIAISYVRGSRMSVEVSVALLIAGTTALVFWGRQGLVGAGIPCGFILLAAINLRFTCGERLAKAIDHLGQASFALYLIHVPIIEAGARILHSWGVGKGDINGWLLFAGIFCVCVTASMLVHFYLEIPINRLIARFRAHRSAANRRRILPTGGSMTVAISRRNSGP